MNGKAMTREERDRLIKLCTTCTAPPEACDNHQLRKKHCAYFREYRVNSGKECKAFTTAIPDTEGRPEKSESWDGWVALGKQLDKYIQQNNISEYV